jgi:hypothetical protein
MRKVVWLLVGALAVGTGCSASDNGTPPTTGVSPADKAAPTDCAGAWTESAKGRVVDTKGSPLNGVSVGFCVYTKGSATCLQPEITGADGSYSYALGEGFRCLDKLAIRIASLPNSTERYSESYCRPPLAPKDGKLELTEAHVLHRLEAPSVLPPLGDPSKPRVISFASGIEFTLVPNDVAEGDLYARLSASELDPKASHCFVPPGLALDGLVAFGPNMNVNVFSGAPNIDFKLPNSANLPEGTVVDLYVLGGLATSLDQNTAIEEGDFVKVGSGVARGQHIVPNADGKLPALTVVGYKRRT